MSLIAFSTHCYQVSPQTFENSLNLFSLSNSISMKHVPSKMFSVRIGGFKFKLYDESVVFSSV